MITLYSKLSIKPGVASFQRGYTRLRPTSTLPSLQNRGCVSYATQASPSRFADSAYKWSCPRVTNTAYDAALVFTITEPFPCIYPDKAVAVSSSFLRSDQKQLP